MYYKTTVFYINIAQLSLGKEDNKEPGRWAPNSLIAVTFPLLSIRTSSKSFVFQFWLYLDRASIREWFSFPDGKFNLAFQHVAFSLFVEITV